MPLTLVMARGSKPSRPILERAAARLLVAATLGCASAEPDDGLSLEPRAGSGALDELAGLDAEASMQLLPGERRRAGPHLDFGYGDARLAGIVGSALSRWARATCLPLSIATEPDHTILMDDERLIPDGREGQTTGASWDGTTVVLREGLPDELAAVLLTHEVCHILARTNGHTHTGVCRPKVSRLAVIDEASLTAVCARRDCGCFRPESPAL